MAETTIEFTTDLSNPADYPDNPDVGRRWEIAINGVGYMLADMRDQ